jgi:hypothetical protein
MIKDADPKARRHTVEFTSAEVIRALRNQVPTHLEWPRSVINEESFTLKFIEATGMFFVEFTTAMAKS